MKKPLIIIGLGETAKLAYEYFKFDSNYEPCLFAVNSCYKTCDTFYDLPVVSLENLNNTFSTNQYYCFIAMGSGRLNTDRQIVFEKIKTMGYKCATYISSKSSVWQNVEIGENCFIMENVTIQPFAKLGNNIIMFSNSVVAHSSVVCDNCFISSGAVISGFCSIGLNSFIGVNATIADKVKIGEFNFIGMGSVINRNTKNDMLYYVDKTTKKSAISAKQLYCME